ncbi:hypothetical protein MPER_16152, partial [Moniliophthora perniciosa FA553]
MADSTAHEIAKSAKAAFEESQLISAEERVKALLEIRNTLAASRAEILRANEEDLAAAKQEVVAGRMSEAMLKRLDLNKGNKWDSMLQGVW